MARLPRGEDCVLVGRGGAAAHPASVCGSDTARPARTGGAPACHAQRAAARRGAAHDRGEAALGRGRARTRPVVAVRQAADRTQCPLWAKKCQPNPHHTDYYPCYRGACTTQRTPWLGAAASVRAPSLSVAIVGAMSKLRYDRAALFGKGRRHYVISHP